MNEMRLWLVDHVHGSQPGQQQVSLGSFQVTGLSHLDGVKLGKERGYFEVSEYRVVS